MQILINSWRYILLYSLKFVLSLEKRKKLSSIYSKYTFQQHSWIINCKVINIRTSASAIDIKLNVKTRNSINAAEIWPNGNKWVLLNEGTKMKKL